MIFVKSKGIVLCAANTCDNMESSETAGPLEKEWEAGSALITRMYRTEDSSLKKAMSVLEGQEDNFRGRESRT